jgi:hypothetical protein
VNTTSMARMVKILLTTGVPFGAMMGLFFALQHGLIAGLVLGPITGLLFGLILAAFSEAQRRRMTVKSGELDGEPVLHQGPANHWRGVEARGGWLVLTPRRLVFRSHGKNIRNEGVELLLADVVSVEPSRSLGIVPNGLRIRHKGDAVEKFVVSERAGWLTALTRAR